MATGNSGSDARGLYSEPALVAEVFAAPYLAYDPSLCLVLADQAGVCGYVIGVIDSAEFATWFNREWRPRLVRQYRDRVVPADAPDAWLFEFLRRPMTASPWTKNYPAHLHIDLLPRAQGRGWGRQMVQNWLELAAQRGATGVHVGVSPINRGAITFYERLGMQRLEAPSGAVLFGLPLMPHEAPESVPSPHGGCEE
ncbi:MAG TPA: GNAT family N-acetyltransferase [Candidatus Synoicihabitans sp.]|nr:GNAT family N-acetyltransferase [Candidatus Synoicihabitans sp.]